MIIISCFKSNIKYIGIGSTFKNIVIQKVLSNDDGILFVDVMTNPWKEPFIRVKFRNKKDIGAIFLNSEKAVDGLIKALNNLKPQLQKYRDIIKDIESTNEET
jgi:hypothetical protein